MRQQGRQHYLNKGGGPEFRKLPVVITEPEFLKGARLVPDARHRLALFLGFYQCLRVSEVVKLAREDVDLKTGFMRLRQAKGGKDRDVPIMKPVISGLRHLPIGLGVRQLQRVVKKQWPNLHFHSLRHSGATMYLNERRIDVRQIQALLGHANLQTTQIYTHVRPDDLKRVFDDVWDDQNLRNATSSGRGL